MIEDMFTQFRDDNGNRTGVTWPATPTEISAAHPKCKSCDHCEVHVHLAGGGAIYECSPPEEIDGFPMRGQTVFPASDYCRLHSELMKGKQDDKG